MLLSNHVLAAGIQFAGYRKPELGFVTYYSRGSLVYSYNILVVENIREKYYDLLSWWLYQFAETKFSNQNTSVPIVCSIKREFGLFTK